MVLYPFYLLIWRGEPTKTVTGGLFHVYVLYQQKSALVAFTPKSLSNITEMYNRMKMIDSYIAISKLRFVETNFDRAEIEIRRYICI